MIRFKSFLNKIYEATVKKESFKRSDLRIGTRVMTKGNFDGVDLDYQIGTIIEMKEYGYILIQFDISHNTRLHDGHNNIGKPKHCFYISFDNIYSIDEKNFEKIIKEIGEKEINKKNLLNAEYKNGDIIVGIGNINSNLFGGYANKNKDINIEDQIGIILYFYGNGSIEHKNRDPKNKRYFIKFLNKFDKNLIRDQYGMLKDNTGAILDKLYMRHITPDEYESNKNILDKEKKEYLENNPVFKIGDIVVGKNNERGIDLKDQLGIIRYVHDNQGPSNSCVVQFFEKFSDYLYDVDNIIGEKTGYGILSRNLRKPNELELEKYKSEIEFFKNKIKSINYNYKVGDLIESKGILRGINFDGQFGKIKKITGVFPKEQFNIEFFVSFNKSLNENKYILYRGYIRKIDDNVVNDLLKKIKNKDILPLKISPSLSLLLDRINFSPNIYYSTLSYFDVVSDKNDVISFLPLDKFKRLEDKEDPFKSRLRQVMKIGKFFRILNDKLIEKNLEALINSYKANHDICITGLSDKLTIVSGEDFRYWYCEEQYVKGGGSLNSSCMRYKDLGPQMQMFVDNPDVIQLLILKNEKNKLLGRAIIWRLVKPAGKTFLDYPYVRYDKDAELFEMYAQQNGWLFRSYRTNNSIPEIICALNTDKKYTMGVNAIDHFDSLGYFNTRDNYLSNHHNAKWVNTFKAKKTEEVVLPFKEGDRVIYKRKNAINDNKSGVFVGLNKNNYCKIVFDDGVKFAAVPKNVYLEKEKD